MIRSMTGYGRAENMANDRRFVVEIKSVNHRYNDISIKLPRSMNGLEDAIRKRIMEEIARGKTDVYITFETFSTDDIIVKVNEALAEAYVEKINELKMQYLLSSEDTLGLVAKFADIITVERVQEEEEILWETLLPALDGAIEKFVQMRQKEGNALAEDILKKRKHIQYLVGLIKERSPLVVEQYQQKMQSRLNELLETVEIDQQRIVQEVAIFADRSCIDEEVIRLESHLVQLQEILSHGGQVGRKLDFLVQEMNREANTIASKANDMKITRNTIELKSEIEKIREQVQNIE
ncbi:MAG TPA: YicC family protein [Candidatus Coprocola pullicola]|nr:YicC family protein [Candidatus Coprocola pullicola]